MGNANERNKEVFKRHTFLSSWVVEALGEIFLLLPLVLLEGVASKGCFGSGGLELTIVDFLAIRVFNTGGVSSKTMLPIGESFSPYGTISKQTMGVLVATPLLFLADLGFVDWQVELFFNVEGGALEIFTFFSQLEGKSPSYQNQSCWPSHHSNMPAQPCLLHIQLLTWWEEVDVGLGMREHANGESTRSQHHP